jgi:putative transposase
MWPSLRRNYCTNKRSLLTHSLVQRPGADHFDLLPKKVVHLEREKEDILKGEVDEMKQSKYSEEQIAFALKQAELGTPISEVCRKLGVSEQTFYRWKSKFGGMLPSDMKRLKQLEEENTKLKKLVADLSLDKAMLQDVLSKKW